MIWIYKDKYVFNKDFIENSIFPEHLIFHDFHITYFRLFNMHKI